MPEYFQRPENALLKAQEFLDVDKQKAALEVLGDVLRSKKHRTWQKVHEAIIFKYLDLCVELRKSQQAKEGLYQYKNICQQVNPKSLEDAILHYLDEAEEKTRDARERSQVTALKMVEDLDMIDTPENMLLKAVTGEQTQDRTDRLLLTPWVKYLWESFRQVLDLLRNNCRVEKLYHIVARRAFNFCTNYDRRTEFRKLCDNLRNHVKLSESRHGTQFSVNLSNPDTQGLHLETKICQLDAAVKIELWQEAFKAVEDIHHLMSLSKRPPKPQTLANFHIKLALVFKKADFMLFHACARHTLFRLTKDMKKNPTRDDLTRMASLLLVSTLAIPITGQKHGIGKILDMEPTLIEKHVTLSKLLGLDRPPTRKGLLDDFMRFNLLEYVPRQLKDLYKWLEKDFHPLRLTERVNSSLQWIQEQTKEPELVQYIKPLQNVVVCRVLQQISTLYQSIKMERLLKLLPFISEFELEQMIMDAARNGQLQARMDHAKRCIYLGTDLNASPLYVEDEFFETQRLQALPSERVSESFNQMTKSLMIAHHMLNKDKIAEKNDETLKELVVHYNKTKQRDHQKILKRKHIIEQRKEQMENLHMERELKEQRAVQEQEEAVKEAEKARLTKEQQEREAKRKEELEKEEKRRSANDRLEMFKKSEIGQKILKDIDVEALEKINPEELMKKQVETLEKEKKEMHDRLKAQEKKVDYFERAKRLAEIPLLKKRAETKRIEDERLWDELEDKRIENAIREQKLALENKKRLSRISEEKDNFMKDVIEKQQQIYKEAMVKFTEKLEATRKERLEQRRRARKMERYTRRKQEKEEQAEFERMEKLRIEQEEEERAAAAAREAEEKQREEKMEKMREQAAKQRERELEIERKLEMKANMKTSERPPVRDDQSSWRTVRRENASGDPRDSWRSREPAATQENSGSGGAYKPPQGRYRPPMRSSEGGFGSRRDEPSSGFGSRRDEPSSGFGSRRDEPRSFDRRTPGGSGFESRRFDDTRGGGFQSRGSGGFQSRDDPPSRGGFDRDRPSGQSSDDRWGRGGQRRSSPTGGISPTRRPRSPPLGRSDSPPRPTRRLSPTGGRRSPQPQRWRRDDAPPPTSSSAADSGSWRANPPSSGGAWRSSRQMQPSETAPPSEGKYRPPAAASSAPYRPRHARQQVEQTTKPPPAADNKDEADDGWSTVRSRR